MLGLLAVSFCDASVSVLGRRPLAASLLSCGGPVVRLEFAPGTGWLAGITRAGQFVAWDISTVTSCPTAVTYSHPTAVPPQPPGPQTFLPVLAWAPTPAGLAASPTPLPRHRFLVATAGSPPSGDAAAAAPPQLVGIVPGGGAAGGSAPLFGFDLPGGHACDVAIAPHPTAAGVAALCGVGLGAGVATLYPPTPGFKAPAPAPPPAAAAPSGGAGAGAQQPWHMTAMELATKVSRQYRFPMPSWCAAPQTRGTHLLRHLPGGGEPRPYLCDSAPFFIVGRDANVVDLHDAHSSVSRLHAAILHHRSGTLYLIDLGSQNGSAVIPHDGAPTAACKPRQSVALRSGAKFTIGKSPAVYEVVLGA